MMLKAPIGDSPAFLRDFHHQKLQEFDSLCTMLETLPHVHVAYYLFRCGGTVSKLQWWCHTTPRAHLSALLQDFHDRQKRTLETFLGSPLNNHQWTQAKLPTKLGGAGLVSTRTEIGLDVVSLADVGFLASHRRCGPSIQQLFSPQPAPNLHDREGPAVRHLIACLPEFGNVLQDPHAQIDHKTMLQRLHHHVYSGLVQQQDRVGQARLTAVAAPSADSWLKAIPSGIKTLFFPTLHFEIAFLCGWEFGCLRTAGLVLSVKIIWTRMVTIV